MLDNIMKLASTNANRQFETLSGIANNIANINTIGYKNVRFEQYLMSDNQLDGVQRVDTSQGAALITRRELDVAIDGFGYIPVTQPDGTVAYTRDGSFTLNSKGTIITQRGDIVSEGINLPANYEHVEIKADGSVLAKAGASDEFKPVGKITLVRFINPEGLKNIGYNKLVATDASGEAAIDPDSKLAQGKLERSNVNVHAQIDQVLRLNAAVISNMRIIKFADDLYRQSVNLRQ